MYRFQMNSKLGGLRVILNEPKKDFGLKNDVNASSKINKQKKLDK
jgi:hypothetical protein